MSPASPPTYAYGYDRPTVSAIRVGVDRGGTRSASLGAVFTSRAGVANRSRGVTGSRIGGIGQQVAVLAALAAGDGDQVLKGYQAGQPDAHLMLRPSEALA
jgi:hypothetical protein